MRYLKKTITSNWYIQPNQKKFMVTRMPVMLLQVRIGNPRGICVQDEWGCNISWKFQESITGIRVTMNFFWFG